VTITRAGRQTKLQWDRPTRGGPAHINAVQ
jgi:hypothetical protein